MGNARNTRRLIPSLATEFNGSTWTTIFNSSSQDATVFGAGVGINGDLYLFVTDSRYGSADYMLCLTTNGDIRWKMYLESPPRMMNTATHHPAQECVNTYKISSNFLAPLALSTKADLLITSVIENAPAAFNTTTFEMLWSDSETMGSDPSADYKADPFTGDIYWIGGDDNMGKMNSNGTRLFINDTNSGGNRDFALDSQRQIVVRAWQNMSDHDWPLIVSAWNVENTGLHERWQWKDDNNNTMNTDCTPPMIDVQNGITYFVNLPYAIALDTNTGNRRWQTEVVTKSDMDNLDLAAECTAFNEQSRV
ncbi:unnamed protein product, partial [Adineta steineri]